MSEILTPKTIQDRLTQYVDGLFIPPTYPETTLLQIIKAGRSFRELRNYVDYRVIYGVGITEMIGNYSNVGIVLRTTIDDGWTLEFEYTVNSNIRGHENEFIVGIDWEGPLKQVSNKLLITTEDKSQDPLKYLLLNFDNQTIEYIRETGPRRGSYTGNLRDKLFLNDTFIKKQAGDSLIFSNIELVNGQVALKIVDPRHRVLDEIVVPQRLSMKSPL